MQDFLPSTVPLLTKLSASTAHRISFAVAGCWDLLKSLRQRSIEKYVCFTTTTSTAIVTRTIIDFVTSNKNQKQNKTSDKKETMQVQQVQQVQQSPPPPLLCLNIFTHPAYHIALATCWASGGLGTAFFSNGDKLNKKNLGKPLMH